MQATERDNTGRDGGGDAEHRKAFRKACDFLSRRSHSTQQLSQKLARHFNAETIGRVLERLRELRYLDDSRFAAEYVAQRLAHSPRGAAMLMAELRTRGVEQSVAEAAVAGALQTEGEGEETLALRVARRKLATLKGPDEEARRARLCRFLSGRGFSTATVYNVVQALLD